MRPHICAKSNAPRTSEIGLGTRSGVCYRVASHGVRFVRVGTRDVGRAVRVPPRELLLSKRKGPVEDGRVVRCRDVIRKHLKRESGLARTFGREVKMRTRMNKGGWERSR